MGISTALEFFKAVKQALKLPPNCRRLVIEAEVGQPLKIYVCGYVPGDALPALTEAVASVTVSEDGEVAVVPLERQAIDTTLFESTASEIR